MDAAARRHMPSCMNMAVHNTRGIMVHTRYIKGLGSTWCISGVFPNVYKRYLFHTYGVYGVEYIGCQNTSKPELSYDTDEEERQV
jgi:hypothetical protein